MRTNSAKARLSAMGTAALAAMLGCQGPQTTPPGVGGHVIEGERQAMGGLASWPSAPVAITPAVDREVQSFLSSRSRWLSGDRIRVGARSAIWGNEPLGHGFLSGGLLPFISRSRLGSGRGFFVYDPGARTVFEVPALRDFGVRDASIGRGGRFITFIDRDGDIGVYDLRSQLIRTFPQLRGRTAFGGFGGRIGLLNVHDDNSNEDGGSFWSSLLDVDSFGNVAYLDRNRDVRLFDTRTGEEFIVPAAGRGLSRINDVSLSGDGRFLVIAGSGRGGGGDGVFAVDLERGRQYSVPFVNGGPRGRIRSVSVSGERILYTEDGMPKVLDMRTGFTENLVLLGRRGGFGGGGRVDDVRFLDSSGEMIAFERDGNIGVFDRANGLVDTLPIVNSQQGFSFFRDRFRFGSLF